MSETNEKVLSAVETGNLESVKNLLNQHGLDSSEGYDALCKSIVLKHKEITKLLLSSGCKANSNKTPSNTPLHFAVHNGDIEIIELLLHFNADMNAKNEDGLTPLLCAVSMDNEVIVDLLLNKGSSLNNYDCISPLHIAVGRGLYKMTEKLLQLGVYQDITCISKEELTPLHCASKIGHSSIVKLLLKNEAKVDSKTAYGMTSMHFASEKGYVEIIKLLLSENADVNSCAHKRLTPLFFAAQNLHREAAKCLMDHGAYINAEFKDGEMVAVENLLRYDFSVESGHINDSVLLHTAAAIGYIEIIQDLINHGLDLVKHCTILHIAVKFRQVEIIKLLLHGADVNATDNAGKTAIYYSTENSDVLTFKLLLSHGASVQTNPELLLVATRNVCKEIVEILLESKVDIEANYEDGRTALHLNADKYIGPNKCNDESQIKTKGEIANLLLSMGANVNAKTYEGEVTALHIACDGGTKNVIQSLLAYKANVNCVAKKPLHSMYRTEENEIPLHIVARTSDIDILELLLKNGADVSSENSELSTPLHVASEECCSKTISLLLEHGSPIDSRNIRGETPLFIAAQAGRNYKILELLLTSGSDINILNNNNKSAFDIYDQSCFDSQDDYLEYIYEDEFASVYIHLRLHLITLKTANLYIREEFLMYLSTGDDSTRLHKQKCEDEIEELKIERISNSRLSLYDILTTTNVDSLANYARNEDIIRVFESNHYKTKFPIYASLIERNFAKGTKRRLLLEEAKEFTICYFQLPYQCTDHILSYLSNDDLENVISVWKAVSKVIDS